MNNTLDTISQPRARSEATVIEQSRAVAEVASQVRAALEFPRDEQAAEERMLRACATMALAEKAFYSVPNRGSGPSVHLARELLRCWGNAQAGMVELRRDDSAGESEMQAFAWDVELGTRFVRSFINPHVRMKGRQRQALTDTNDIINQNNNAAARALRETIFNVLPVEFVEKAKAACEETLRRGNGQPLADRIRGVVDAFGKGGITQAQLEARIALPVDEWDEQSVATLGVIWSSLKAGETTRDDEFPPAEPARTLDDISKPSGAPEHPADSAPAVEASRPGAPESGGAS